MNQELDKLRKEMTREEFINFHSDGWGCPELFDLTQFKKCGDIEITCAECWKEAVKDIQFKDDIEILEVLTDGKKEELSTIKTTFSTGAWRNNKDGKGRYDLMPWTAIHELAKHCQDGAKAHGERNIDKGIPLHDLMDSAIRHISQYMQGQTNENHLRSAFWNIAWAVEFEVTKPDLQDIPARMKNEI
jgi:cell division protein YceG involved in septum cleavage